ncbi:carbamoyltransferase [Plantibacter sp. VKM Ac-1784]|uniref:Carbamoyltransferase n=1 Tax=Plantibacter elymi (nom. nud.) TaxID=199708 RepID=A0ABY1R7E9_9MICO|nr:carbamoyltransferase C-terminal domain-containing protein [Plantibacter sp. VKM Ac-1784]SMQ58065.1 carbamoyltransferase [Plantibacter sp. VKM Ac-1784]
MSVLGIYDGHNAGAALVSERGRVIAAVEEERFSRIKNHDARPGQSAPPYESVAFCLAASPEPVTRIAFGLAAPAELSRNAMATFDACVAAGESQRLSRAAELGLTDSELRELPASTQRRRVDTLSAVVAGAGLGAEAPVAFVDHHAAHAGGAYLLSGLDQALVVTLDGKGDNLSGSVSVGDHGTISRTLEIPSEDSLGHLYSAFTVACGLRPQRDEGKLQAMAASGSIDRRIRSWLEDRFELDGRSGAIRGKLSEGLVIGPYPDRRPDLHNDLVREIIGGSRIVDVAATVQNFLEQVVAEFVTWHLARTGLRTLVVSGGVFANVSLNHRLADLGAVDRLHVHPAMTDAGIAMGAAVVTFAAQGTAPQPLRDLGIGPTYSDRECADAFEREGFCVTTPRLGAEVVLGGALARGEVVARFVGGAEYGPRALGNRSILAPANNPSMPVILNRMLRRSTVMPFAPMARARDAVDLFAVVPVLADSFRTMTAAVPCTVETRRRYPAIVHADGTARPQLLDDDERATAIIDELERRTGQHVIINTSFNLHDEPMVCRPIDAARSASAAGITTVQIGGMVAKLE